ncbi:DUF3040 domain-containing protein [Streptomyces carpinensis]|uniref:DUF3040 domain-containing protein n=1 Tax=Streptomyces carpinensis TaxID=66369 RepID=A0ABV1WB30_9ACTN|nr:DUF3040 domain-containing protein [Streptomyces carpinensis]
MSTSRLPDHEQRILDEIERALSRDRRLARRLSTSRRRGPDLPRVLSRAAAYISKPWAVVVLLGVTVTLLTAGIVTSDPGVIWAFAVVWPPTLYAVVRLLSRRSRTA